MDDALPVRVVERLRGLARDAERIDQRQRPLAPEAVVERLAVDEGHREPEPSAVLAGVVHRLDVRCSSRAALRTASRKRSSPIAAPTSRCSSLSATQRSFRTSRARKTVAMRPRPTSRSMR